MNDEIALVQLEVYDARLEELDIEAALTTRQTLCAMRLTQCSADQTSPFSECYFLRIVFDGDGYLTATTCIAFCYLQGIRAVSQVGVPKDSDLEPDYGLAETDANAKDDHRLMYSKIGKQA